MRAALFGPPAALALQFRFGTRAAADRGGGRAAGGGLGAAEAGHAAGLGAAGLELAGDQAGNEVLAVHGKAPFIGRVSSGYGFTSARPSEGRGPEGTRITRGPAGRCTRSGPPSCNRLSV